MQSISVNEEHLKVANLNQWITDQLNCSSSAISNKIDNNNESGSEEICDMLKMLSHDIRSPLVTIGATLKLLKRGAYGVFDEGANNELEKLLRLVIQATGVMEDLMGMAFSLSNTPDEHREILNIREDIFYPVILELKKIMEDREVVLFNEGFKVGTEKNALTLGNRFLLKSVFRNLINNAIRYGGKGCKISCSIVKQASFNMISLFNTGKSISESDQNKLFSKNMHSENSRGNGGMGMGLYLVKEIIRKNGGKIWYEACKNGSKFIFTLPCI